jgi:hypothetical protein
VVQVLRKKRHSDIRTLRAVLFNDALRLKLMFVALKPLLESQADRNGSDDRSNSYGGY